MGSVNRAAQHLARRPQTPALHGAPTAPNPRPAPPPPPPQSAEDYRLDPKLHSACAPAAAQLCASEDPADALSCLTQRETELGWDCLEQVVRFQREVRGRTLLEGVGWGERLGGLGGGGGLAGSSRR